MINAAPPMRAAAFDGEADEDLVHMLEAAPGVAVMGAHRIQVRGGFDLGTEAGKRKRQIRAAQARGGGWAPDPLCCLAPERVFPQPSYTERYDGPRVDFRDTLLWQPRVRTDAAGKAEVSFYLSDAVTSFKVAAEGAGGGWLGRGEAQVQAKKPVSLAVKLPLEVAIGDRVRLPVTVANETPLPYTASFHAAFGKAFAVRSAAVAPQIELAPRERRSIFYDLEVVGDGTVADDGKIAIAVEAANLRDDVERVVKVAPIGFPQEAALAGTLSPAAPAARHELHVSDVLPGTMRGVLTFYPSPLATMVKGTEAMISEPGGCFEQASSTNYPNVMILGYLEEHGAADPALIAKTHAVLDRGYKLLTGYETKERGYEWFGSSPGHEALTAYGLLEFRDMQKVFAGVDGGMVERTRAWLRGRRDGKGGYHTNARALDTFGRASAEVTDGYITYALAQAGERDLGPEIGRQRGVAAATNDPYLMALATQVLLDTRPGDEATRAAARRLAGMQDGDGAFPGADHSITRSGGASLAVETTALAALALLAAGPEHAPAAHRAIAWLDGQRTGAGGFGSTQATVLALKAMAVYAKDSRRTEAPGTITLTVNGAPAGRVTYDKGHQGAIELDVGPHLRPGKNVVEVHLESAAPLPYSGAVRWGSKVPATHPDTRVALATRLAKPAVRLGEGVRLDVTVTNTTAAGVPMTLARVGLPGGLAFQTWQLQELRDRRVIDFYETREREVILYFRALGPRAAVQVPLELLATVPGTFTAPASRAYLYYTDEHKHWVAPSVVTVTP